MILDLSSLVKAIAQLEEALALTASDIAKHDPRLAFHLRAASIQAFVFTYELCFKTLKRYLEQTETNPSVVEELTFNELIRRGYEVGLLRAVILQPFNGHIEKKPLVVEPISFQMPPVSNILM